MMSKLVALLVIWKGSAFVLPGCASVTRPRAKASSTTPTILKYRQRSDVVVESNRTVDNLASGAHPFVPWPEEVIESEGNYANPNEAYLEKHIGGPLYENNVKKNLPQLPIPSLQETIAKFIPTALPLCESEEEKHTLLEACQKFENEAKHLQERLLKRQSEWSDSSWLQKWWNQIGYFNVRSPVVVHVSYFLNINDDPSLPTQEEMDAAPEEFFGATNPAILRGAMALHSSAVVRRRICSGQAPCDKVGDTPLCSTGFKYLFNSVRIPRIGEDKFRIYDPCKQKHCIVASRGYFFAIDFVDDQANPLPLDLLVKRLQKVEVLAKRQEENDMPKLGFLTGCDREFWARAHSQLLEEGGTEMKNAMELIESGALVICLDDARPETSSDANEIFWHGNGQGNRWFDKSIQLVCTKNGQIALVGEHSMFDGSSPMVICKQIKRSTFKRLRRMQLMTSDAAESPDDGVGDIFGQCWEGNKDLISTAKDLEREGQKKCQELTGSVELKTLLHEGYGKTFLKKSRVSPDALIQLAIQLAGFRVFGKQLATYEATQTRQFIHGRTETTRTVSLDSQAFVEAMGPSESSADVDDPESKCKQVRLLRKATQTHHDFTVEAANGKGVDRHFLGLGLVLEDDEIPPSLFGHPTFVRSKSWRLSTSSLPFCPGFGPVVADGLGIGYGISNDSCVFNIASWKKNDFVDRFCHELEKALIEIRVLLEYENRGAP